MDEPRDKVAHLRVRVRVKVRLRSRCRSRVRFRMRFRVKVYIRGARGDHMAHFWTPSAARRPT